MRSGRVVPPNAERETSLLLAFSLSFKRELIPRYRNWLLRSPRNRRLLRGLKDLGCAEDRLIWLLASAAIEHKDQFGITVISRKTLHEGAGRYGLPKHRVRTLPKRLRDMANDLDIVNRSLFIRTAFELGHLGDAEAVSRTLRDYATSLEEAYRWAARVMGTHKLNVYAESERRLVAYVRRRTKRPHFRELGELLDAMLDYYLKPEERSLYKVSMRGDSLRKRNPDTTREA